MTYFACSAIKFPSFEKSNPVTPFHLSFPRLDQDYAIACNSFKRIIIGAQVHEHEKGTLLFAQTISVLGKAEDFTSKSSYNKLH